MFDYSCSLWLARKIKNKKKKVISTEPPPTKFMANIVSSQNKPSTFPTHMVHNWLHSLNSTLGGGALMFFDDELVVPFQRKASVLCRWGFSQEVS